MHMSSPIRAISPWLISIVTLLMVQTTIAAPLLNGVAPFQQLGKERFVAALYSDSLTDNANDILGTTQQRSMELRITADALSTRRLNRLWIEGMAINNAPDILSQEAEHMVSFTKLLKGKLYRGDHLRLDYRTGAGTEVTVNGMSVGNIPGEHFFDLLLRTWVGSIPLSSTFKSHLLSAGDVDDETLSLYNSLQPTPDRTDIVKQWQNAEKAKAAALVVEEEQQKKADIAPDIAKPTVAVKPTLTAPAKIAPPSIPAKTPAKSEEAKPQAKVATQPTAKAKPAVAKLPSKPPAQDTEDDDDESDTEEFTAASLIDQQRYHSQLLRWCYKYLKYPAKAAARNQQGSVRIFVSIDRKGHVTQVDAEEESPYNLLNREALNAIERANPFPPVPDTIKGEQYNFTLPIVFRLPD